MGILSEALHEAIADELRDLLLKAATDPKYNDCRDCVKDFAKTELLPMYKKSYDNSYNLKPELHNQVLHHYGFL